MIGQIVRERWNWLLLWIPSQVVMQVVWPSVIALGVTSIAPVALLLGARATRVLGWFVALTQALLTAAVVADVRADDQEALALAIVMIPLVQWPGGLAIAIVDRFARRRRR